ncbi:MAG: ATP-binding protein [Deltaproteobacteria bacterium]|nr:ATP-binding protein [Deltaproteobacteria bacterium]
MYPRLQTLKGRRNESCFLWGPRQTGKSTLVKRLFPQSPYYDLLLSDEFLRLQQTPALLREEIEAVKPQGPVVIDEVQKMPALLDEVHWLIVNRHIQFVLLSSSARKLKRGGGNLLGGRALRYELHPLVFPEIPDFDLFRALNHGLVPRHYSADNPEPLLRSYVGDYLKEEIAAEALTRNLPAFSRFLEVAAFSNGDIVNYQNVARECGISAPTARDYFQILEDTLIGRFIPAYRKKQKRRLILTPRFYFFDVGIVNILLKRGRILPRSESLGRAFEHFVFQELSAHRHYSGLEYPLAYWRTASQFEVDFILGDHEITLEVKAVEQITGHHLRGLRAFMEEHRPKWAIVVSLDPRPRKIGPITIMPWKYFLTKLWDGDLIH